MTALQPATLQRLTRVGKPSKNEPARVTPDGDALPVQFNPASLRLTRRNNVDRAGTTTGSQTVQHPSTEPSTLTFELEFDTAEQGTATSRVNVRDWTALVRQFVEPPEGNEGEAAPAVQFQWGKLIFRGIVTDVAEELDFFAPDGTPLHAKLNVTISEQRFELEAKEGPAGRDARGASSPGGGSAAGGLGVGAFAAGGFSASFAAGGSFSAGFGASASLGAGASVGMSGTVDAQLVVAALDGESAQQLLARLDKDPAAWRAAMSGLDSPLALDAGASVQLGAEVDAGVGAGVQAGFTASGSVDTEAALAAAVGVGVHSSGSAGFRADARADGFALAAAGGVASATARVDVAVVNATTAEARGSFDVPPGSPALSVDARATTYGRGVPMQGSVSLQAAATGSAGWSADATADAEQRSRDAGASTLRWSPRR